MPGDSAGADVGQRWRFWGRWGQCWGYWGSNAGDAVGQCQGWQGTVLGMQGRAGSCRDAVGQRQGLPWGRTGNTKAESGAWGCRGAMLGVPGMHCPVPGMPGKQGQNRGSWRCYGMVLGMQGPVPGMPGGSATDAAGQIRGRCRAEQGILQGRAGNSRAEPGIPGQSRECKDRCGGPGDAVGQHQGCRRDTAGQCRGCFRTDVGVPRMPWGSAGDAGVSTRDKRTDPGISGMPWGSAGEAGASVRDAGDAAGQIRGSQDKRGDAEGQMRGSRGCRGAEAGVGGRGGGRR